jgi:hypothetical protein
MVESLGCVLAPRSSSSCVSPAATRRRLSKTPNDDSSWVVTCHRFTGDSGAGEMGGTIDNTLLTGNTVTVSSVAGDATAGAGASIFAGTMTNGVVSGNSVHATSPRGAVLVVGGGLQTGGALTLRTTVVSDNTGDARGGTGTAEGGGIFAVDESPNGPPGGPLILTNSRISGNDLSGSADITLQGGGLFVTNPLTVINSTVTGNDPDNCFGSSC